jgi:hypothetical protein
MRSPTSRKASTDSLFHVCITSVVRVCCNILTHDDASSAIELGFHVAGRGSSVPQAWTIGKYDYDHYANIADPISAHEAQEKITNIL